MIVYHFISPESALKALRDRRLKMTRLNQLNDLQELCIVDLFDSDTKRELEIFKNRVNAQYGMICFSAIYHDPVLWGHYADSHRGVALVFDIPDHKAITINYQPEQYKQIINTAIHCGEFESFGLSKLISTKFSSWHYEQEVRMICDLNDHFCQIDAKGNKAYFESLSLEPFGKDALKLVGLIRGVRCDLKPMDIAGELLAADTLSIQDASIDSSIFQITSSNAYLIHGVRSFSACCFRV